jgi:hypothetical protein
LGATDVVFSSDDDAEEMGLDRLSSLRTRELQGAIFFPFLCIVDQERDCWLWIFSTAQQEKESTIVLFFFLLYGVAV